MKSWLETRVDGGGRPAQASAHLDLEAASDTSKGTGRVGRVGEFPGGLEACKESLSPPFISPDTDNQAGREIVQ